MIDRRTFLGALGSSLAISPVAPGRGRQAQAAGHGDPPSGGIRPTPGTWESASWWDIPWRGAGIGPPLELVSTYVDQFPDNDLSRARSREFGFPIYPTIAESLRRGGDKLDVDGVLLIGGAREISAQRTGTDALSPLRILQGDRGGLQAGRPDRPRLQRQAPLLEVGVVQGDGGYGPRHGGSRFWPGPRCRSPGESPPSKCLMAPRSRKSCACPSAGVDSYDFHALETIQCMVERRRGGETGVDWLHAMRGEPVWEAMGRGSFDGGGWDPHTLLRLPVPQPHPSPQAKTVNHRYPTPEQIRQWVEKPVVYRLPTRRWTESHHDADERPGGRLHLCRPAQGPVRAPLHAVLSFTRPQRGLHSGPDAQGGGDDPDGGKPPTPWSARCSHSGLVTAGVHSLGQGGKKLETPHLAVRYQAPRESHFLRS